MSGSTFWTAQDQGLDPKWYDDGQAVRAPLGDAVGDAFDQARSFTGSVFDWMRRTQRDRVAGGALTDEQGQPLGIGSTERVLTPAEANEAYGIQGQLQFQGPLTETSARELRDIKRAELARADTMSRTEAELAGMGAVAAAGLVGSLLDPLNVASAFVPAVSATRSAAWLAQAGSRLGRVGAAARIGAIDGAAGAVLLEPLQYGLAQAESQDYGPADSLLNVAFGAVLGGLLHGAGRAAVDGWRGWRTDVEPETVRAVHEQAVRAAAAQVERGEPVNVAPIITAAREAEAAFYSYRDMSQAFGRANPYVRPEAANDPSVLLPGRREVVPFEGAGEGARLGRDTPLAPDGPPIVDGDALLPPGQGGRAPGLEAPYMPPEWRRGTSFETVEMTLANANELGGPRFPGEAAAPGSPPGAGPRRPDAPGLPPGSIPPDDPAAAAARGAGDQPQPGAPGGVRAAMQAAAAPHPRQEDARAMAMAADALARQDAPARATAAAPVPPALEQQVTRQDAVLREHLAAGRITEAEFAALADTAGAEKAASRGKALKAAAACLIGNGA